MNELTPRMERMGHAGARIATWHAYSGIQQQQY